MRRTFHLSLLLALAGLFGGCAYTEARLLDLTDIAQAKVTLGKGIAASVRLPWVGIGLGHSEGVNAGFGYRGIGAWSSERTDVQLLVPYIHTEDNFKSLAGSMTQYGVGDRGVVEKWPPGGSELEFERMVAPESYESYLRVGLTLQFFLGADVELRPVEAVDFLLGIFTIDFRGDDPCACCMKPEPPEK